MFNSRLAPASEYTQGGDWLLPPVSTELRARASLARVRNFRGCRPSGPAPKHRIPPDPAHAATAILCGVGGSAVESLMRSFRSCLREIATRKDDWARLTTFAQTGGERATTASIRWREAVATTGWKEV